MHFCSSIYNCGMIRYGSGDRNPYDGFGDWIKNGQCLLYEPTVSAEDSLTYCSNNLRLGDFEGIYHNIDTYI